jgi:hypothetical protein
MAQVMEPEFAYAAIRNQNNRSGDSHEDQYSKNMLQMAAEKEGNKDTTQGTTAGSKQETSETTRQDTSKQQTKSADTTNAGGTMKSGDTTKAGETMKSGKQETESGSSTKEGKAREREQQGGNRNSPSYCTYSYSKSYRNINGDTYSTEKYVVDTPNMKFIAEKPEDSNEFTVEYEKGGKDISKDKRVIPESIEDDLHRLMSRVNTELNFSDLWYSPFSRRWSPFNSIEQEFERDFQSMFREIESNFDGSSRRGLEGGQRKRQDKRQLKASSKHEEKQERDEKKQERDEKKQERDEKKGREEKEHEEEEDTGRTERSGPTRTTRV